VLAVGLALAALAPAGCSDGGPGSGEARLEVDGQAIVSRHDGGKDVVDGKTDLHRGDRVELTKGTGRMAMRDGVRMELRSGLGDAADSLVLMGTTPVLEAGDLLVAAPDQMKVSAAGTTLVIEKGAARISRALGLGVAAYDGIVHLDSAGIERDVSALREMQVPAIGRPPHAGRPFDYKSTDPWDRQFLGDAIAFGEHLQRLADGYTNNLNPGEGRTPGFFRLVLPGLDDEPQFGDKVGVDIDRQPGETLIGAAIADLGHRGEFADRWASVFEFRDAGAAWGLVALDQAVSDDPLLGSIEQAVASSPLTFAAARPSAVAPSQSSSPVPPTTTTTPPTQSPPKAPPTTPPPGPVPTVPPTVPPLPPADPLTPVVEPAIKPVTDVVSGLVGGLLGLLGPPPGG
jgi:hypothetical protein